MAATLQVVVDKSTLNPGETTGVHAVVSGLAAGGTATVNMTVVVGTDTLTGSGAITLTGQKVNSITGALVGPGTLTQAAANSPDFTYKAP